MNTQKSTIISTLLSGLLVLFGFSSFAQAPGQASYQFTGPGGTVSAQLIFDAQTSLFIISSKTINSLEEQDRVKQVQVSSSENNNTTTNRISLDDTEELYILKDFEKGKMICRDAGYDGTVFNVIDSVPDINWTTHPDQKEVLGFTCYRATGEFRCKKFEVWFCPAVNTIAGPWKLNGLPGLILQVSTLDDGGDFSMQAVALEYPASTALDVWNNIERYAQPSPVVSFTDFATHQRKEFEKIKIFLTAQAGGSDVDFSSSVLECFEETKH